MTDLFSITGKTALVTGGSRGIGRMIAGGFVDAGARVYISSRRADVCEEVASRLGAAGECYALPADLGSEQGVAALAATLVAREPRLHILVNNAGATWGAPLEQFPAHAFDKVMALNVRAVFDLTRRLLPALRAAASPADPARVINIGSVAGFATPEAASTTSPTPPARPRSTP